MAKLIWFNQPANHSGWDNIFYLTPDGEVESFGIYRADSGGCYLLGGPLLTYHGFSLLDAAYTLISFLDAGFHFFPESRADAIRQHIVENRKSISDDSPSLDPEEWWYGFNVYSNAYSTTQCCDMLLSNTTPSSAIIFIDREEDGHVLLATKLAHIYYKLPKEQREELGLKADWRPRFD